MILAAIARTAQTQRELVERQIEGTHLIEAGRLGANHGRTSHNGQFHADGGVMQTWIAFMRQHDLYALRVRRNCGHTIHLAFDDVTELLLDLNVTACQNDIHVDLPRLKRLSHRYIRTERLLPFGYDSYCNRVRARIGKTRPRSPLFVEKTASFPTSRNGLLASQMHMPHQSTSFVTRRLLQPPLQAVTPLATIGRETS